VNSRDQVRLAGKLGAALNAGGLEFVSEKRDADNRMTAVPSELVDLIGLAFSRNFRLQEVGSTVLPPARPHLVREGKGT
jgi:hypothetical protein